MDAALAAPVAEPTVGRRRARLAGAALGSILCAGLLVALYAAAAIEPVEDLFRLAPLCALCVAAGAVWAWILRRALTGSGAATRSTLLPTTGVVLLVPIGVILVTVWLVLAPVVAGFLSGEAVFD